MPKIFISYSSADRSWAEYLEGQLTSAGLDPFRDKTRLTLGEPFQEGLFRELENSSILLVVWSSRVRDMKGKWKEWVITEREQFRARHPTSSIIYVLLDEDSPQVDAHIHKLDLLQGVRNPAEATASQWQNFTSEIKKIAYSDSVQIYCYLLAATKGEFDQLEDEVNLRQILKDLDLSFSQVSKWYEDDRTDWKPAGGENIKQIIGKLETSFASILKEGGVPKRFRDCQIVTSIVTEGLWSKNDPEITEEINRLARLDFCWIIIDQLSLFHDRIQKVANRIGACADRNQRLNIFLFDPIGRLLDRRNLRSKLQNDFSNLYSRLVRPKLLENASCLGGIDVWHEHDFERVFRETIRLHRLADVVKNPEKVPERALAHFAIQ